MHIASHIFFRGDQEIFWRRYKEQIFGTAAYVTTVAVKMVFIILGGGQKHLGAAGSCLNY